ncbi:MAG: type II toxin-antitoxin system RelB family antitoxin [Beijerinckiaceae bacterium]
MLALRLPTEIEARLEALAKRTGRTKSFYAREAIIEKIEDLEDYYLADLAMTESRGIRYSIHEVADELGIDLDNLSDAETEKPPKAAGSGRKAA